MLQSNFTGTFDLHQRCVCSFLLNSERWTWGAGLRVNGHSFFCFIQGSTCPHIHRHTHTLCPASLQQRPWSDLHGESTIYLSLHPPQESYFIMALAALFPLKTTSRTTINSLCLTGTPHDPCVCASSKCVRGGYSQERSVSPPHWTRIMSCWSVEGGDNSYRLSPRSPAIICQLPACKMSYRCPTEATTLIIAL